MKTKLSNVSCKYGAPMGRTNAIPDRHATPKLYLERLRFVDGCYDQGGAYWGAGTPLYRAEGEADGVDERYELFVRARSRADAKAEVQKLIPAAYFYR